MAQTLGIGEGQAAVVALRVDAMLGQPGLPEVERLLGGDAPDDQVDHPRAGAAGRGAGILEERQVHAGRALVVAVKQVIDGRIVLVDALLDHPQPEHAT